MVRFDEIFRRFRRDARANVAMIFALVSVALVVAIGLAVDLTRSLDARQQLQKASDAAALAATRTASAYVAAQGTYNATVAAAAVAKGVAAAQATFAANLAGTSIAATASITPTVTVPSALSATATTSASAYVPTTLMSVVGKSSIDFATSSTAVYSLPVNYYQFVFLVDVSGSMTIGGTTSDLTKLQSTYFTNFKDSTDCPRTWFSSYSACGFACHDPNNVYPCASYPDNKTRRVTAANKGVKLKIDYVKSAIDTFMSSLSTAISSSGADAVASIYTFGTNFKTVDSGVTLATAKTDAASIQIETIDPSNNWGYTNTTSALNTLSTTLTNVGDGSSSTRRKTYVVFVTDGLEDVSGSCSAYGRCTGVGYTTGCSKVKAVSSNLVFVSIEATYPTVSGDTQYTTIVAPYASAMQTAMKACATSSSWYFSADDGPGIESAMSNVVSQINSTIRLSQ